MRVITAYPVAWDSIDHIIPYGTLRDNSRNEAFNDRLIAMFPSGLSVLDLGCSGGGFVRSLLDRGVPAFGIEGSDISRALQRAEWGPEGCPNYLATADISKPFIVLDADGGGRFKVVTAWEVLEHIADNGGLTQLSDNVANHLERGGIFVASISPNEESVSEMNPAGEVVQTWKYHQTVRPKDWWVTRLAELGWRSRPDLVEWFDGNWVRDESNAPGSFHLVLERI